MGWLSDESGLGKTAANHVPLTPLSYLKRAALLYPARAALIYHGESTSYRSYHARVSRLASALARRGIRPGDVVATLLPNVPAQCEAHFGVPAAGAILNTINTRLDVATVAYILDHGGARCVLVDSQFLALAEQAIARLEGQPPEIIEVGDARAGHPASGRHCEYETLLVEGEPDFDWIMPQDEWESLALNYTSGTTGRPKGVVYHHRGAYLMTMGTAVCWPVPNGARYLSIVPLFHCNGWNHIWLMPMLGASVVCLRDITASAIYNAIADHGVTHFGAAPIVLNTLINAHDEDRRPFDHIIQVFTAGAPPAAATLKAIEPLGFNVTQVYGLTETYGAVTECLWQGDQWDDLPNAEKYAIKARAGVAMPMMEHITVMDPDTMEQVPMDGESASERAGESSGENASENNGENNGESSGKRAGKSSGEIMIRGNCVMKGYLKNPAATAEAFKGGYFHSGDIAHQTPDSYIRITDRAKDIIISGGENVSSVEVEGVLMHHPAVSMCAVVAKPDDKWGEVPCAFVELKEGAQTTEAALIAFVRTRLAGFKTPKQVIFQELPKTATGKIQKFELRKHLDKIAEPPIA